MKILFIAPYVPSLVRVRPFQFVRALANLGHQVTVAALGVDGREADQEAREKLAPFCHALHVVPLSKHQALLSCATKLHTGMPLWAAYCQSPQMDRLLNDLVTRQNYDLIHVEHLRAAHFAASLRGKLPAVFDSVDCITNLQEQLMRSPSLTAAAKSVSRQEVNKLRRYEPRMAALFDQVLVTSDADLGGLQALACAQNTCLPIHTLPNGVDLEYFRPVAPSSTHEPNIVFTGKMSYAANHDAALYLCKDLFPLIRRQFAAATLTIAGSGPRPQLLAAAARMKGEIEVTGRVPDLRPYLGRAQVAACPLRIGVGIQNKVLEAMAMGRAVVTTPIASRALAPSAVGESLCVAETASEIADQVVRLLNNPSAAERLGVNARRYVETHHNWAEAGRRLEEVYGDAIRAFRVRTGAQDAQSQKAYCAAARPTNDL